MRRIAAAFWLLCALAAAQAQDTQKVLDAFQRNFTIGSLDVKIQIIQDAASSKDATALGPLYQQAVDFVINNATMLPSDPRFRQLASLAADSASKSPYTPARFSLWKLFQIDSDTTMRTAIMTALGTLAAGDQEIIAGINRFLDNQNSVVAAGKQSDPRVIAAVVTALGKLGDPSSFPFLFTAMNLGYSAEVGQKAGDSLLSLKGDLKDMFMAVIKASPPAEKSSALVMALQVNQLSNDQKGQVAEYALDVALHTGAADTDGKEALRQIRMNAAVFLREAARSSATQLLIENLDMTILEFDRGLTDKRFLIEAVSALAAMGNHEAAVRLTQYLVLLNSYTERGKGYDEQVVLGVVGALQILADKVSFDDLMYTQYLNYSAPIKKLARDALEKLKW